ncbi:MAG: valine--tRNA ligase [Chloroflexota bacterium]|nr:MAG: valine--tRNA ligase [Chloroflexota bacterium]
MLRADRAMERAYNHLTVEQRVYADWETSGAFTPSVPPGGRSEVEPHCIVIPPPNVTGVLHHGSAMFITLQDVLTRWRRMQGRRTLWLPGTDHAGIATQNVVEAALAREGLTRHDLGRERFIERVWQWKHEYGSVITEQMRRMGASVDWTRERFTLDPGLSRAVREAFVRLYEKGLIYRGSYIVNWCPRCATVLSDLEVDHVDTAGHLWHARYPLVGDPERAIVVATTRPETMLGDTGVAVHPEDERYRDLIGREVELPLVGRRIPIVADEAVDRAFGTGAVKVTPAHDPTDYEIGRRAGLASINVMNPDGTINGDGGPFEGLDRYEARRRIVAQLAEGAFLVATEAHRHAVAQCSRCDTILEPRISEQWFVRMKPLAEPAIAAVRDGRIRILPERFERIYFNWMENIRDWVISRQLWWGHRIPVWYCDSGNHQIVSREDPTTCPTCGGALRQDDDVLDTWFSSALWPFSTLGWPEQTDDLKYFYPTTVMETGYDIIFFWVARMIMTGIEFMGEAPFSTVYLHGMVRHADGSKISKSNYQSGDNPLEVIERFGADALRFTLATGSTPGNDLRISLDRIEGNRNFTNKLWNAARFVVGAGDRPVVRGTPDLADRWIRQRSDAVTNEVTAHLDGFNFGEAGRTLYEFAWNEYCDWYIEIAKLALRSGDSGRRDATLATLYDVLERMVTLLHPFIPFVTEEIWSHLRPNSVRLIATSWPTVAAGAESDDVSAMDAVIAVTRAIRNIRTEQKVDAGRRIDAILAAGDLAPILREQAAAIAALGHLARLDIREHIDEAPPQAVRALAGDIVIFIPLAGMLDLAAERRRLTGELQSAIAQRDRVAALLANGRFVAGARPDVVERERGRLIESEQRVTRLTEQLESLGE